MKTKSLMVTISVALPIAIFVAAGFSNLPSKGKEAKSACASCTFSQSSVGDNPTMVKVTAGLLYQFRIDQNSNLPSGGTWTCEYGSVDTSGNYTAPTFQPPWGQDTITYEAPSGDEAKLEVLVAANPNLPDSGYPKYIRVPAGQFDSTNLEPDPAAEVISGANGTVIANGTLAQITAAYPSLPTYEADDEILVAPQTTECNALVPDISVPEGNRKMRAAILPTQDVVGNVSHSMVVLFPGTSLNEQMPQVPKKCVIWPVNPLPSWRNDLCSVGTRDVDSKVKTKGPKLVPPLQSGSMEFSAAANLKLGQEGVAELGLGFEIGVKYPVTRQITYWEQMIKRDVWKCVNGHWKFAGTKTCRRSGFGEAAFPKWVAVIDGYPVNGMPNTWTSWDCD